MTSRTHLDHLRAERRALERMLDDTPEEDVIDRASLGARLERVVDALAEAASDEIGAARVKLTFRGKPVVGTVGIFADFGMKAVSAFTEAIAAIAASSAGPLAATGPIPGRDQHQLLITNTALGSFGFELKEHHVGQLSFDEPTATAQALDRAQLILRGSLGTDDDLADSVADVERRALDKLRAFLQTLVDNDAVCALQTDGSFVRFTDVGQVATSLARLSVENLKETEEEIIGVLLGVLPRSRTFELEISATKQIVRGKIGPAIRDAGALNAMVQRAVRVQVVSTRVGGGRPRYVMTAEPVLA